MSAVENPQAFPRPASQWDYPGDTHEYILPQDGASLRDYFAAKALQGIMSNTDYLATCAGQARGNSIPGIIAMNCYELADFMLLERSKQK